MLCTRSLTPPTPKLIKTQVLEREKWVKVRRHVRHACVQVKLREIDQQLRL